MTAIRGFFGHFFANGVLPLVKQASDVRAAGGGNLAGLQGFRQALQHFCVNHGETLSSKRSCYDLLIANR